MSNFAYTALLVGRKYAVCRADRNIGGHTPQPQFGVFDVLTSAQEVADKENEKLDISKREATEIVLSTLFRPVGK